ncbi:MAG: helix-turn-helix transcriptional regulator [Clostridia bacterium]|nr:helix-turn-helix transcriptional regulator [Clostridia bacterium]
MIKFRIDVMSALRERGYTARMLLKEGVNSSTQDKLRNDGGVSFSTLSTLCKLLECNVEDLIEYIPD